MPHMQDVPIEILEIVAGYLDGDSALALTGASHGLRSSLNTVSNWRSILNRQCGLMDRSGFETGVRLYGPRLSVQTRPDEEDPTAVMHYAVATSRGVVMLDELDTEKLQMAGDDPTLIMARYVEYVGTARYLGYRVRQPERTATSLLTHWINAFPSLPGSDTVGRQPLGKRYIDLTRQRPAHHLAFGGLSLRLSLILTIETLGLENKWVRTGLQDTGRIRVMATALNTNCDTTGNECRLDAALLRLTLVAFRLQEAAGEPHPSLRPSTPCPRATSFPICRNRYLSEVPTPLRLTDEAGLPELAWVRWVKELSRSEANLNEASVWEGYYLYRNVPTRVARMDQPMRDVELLFDKGESRYVGITGKGADQHGPFTLVGTMNWESLRFSILKQYIGAHAFRWYGVLTPFGMVGTWHQPRAQDPNDEVGDDDPDPSDDPYRSSLGSFWLWRRHTEANPCPTYD